MKRKKAKTKTNIKKDIVQIKNPKTGLYLKIDRSTGKILAHKKTAGMYKGVKVARKRI